VVALAAAIVFATSDSLGVVASACRLSTESPGTGRDGDLLSSVSTDRTGGLWAVGSHYDGGHGRALVLRSSDDGWGEAPLRIPANEAGNAQLEDVTAISPQDAWAVGVNGQSRAVIVHWNGTRWRDLAVSADVAANRGLLGIAAVSGNDVWAVGRTTSGLDITSLVERWNGSNWSAVASPSPSPYLSVLEDVVAIDAADVWAVGYGVRGGLYRSLVEHWDGGGWEVVRTPDVSGADDVLTGVAAMGPDDVWAVGWTRTQSGPARSLVLHWDGATWTRVDLPSLGARETELTAVAVASGRLVAVGRAADAGSVLRPFALRWDGRTWAEIPVEPNPVGEASLFDVTSDAGVVVVGTGLFESGFGSLVGTGC
jgi:hypothetical protein